MSTQLDPASTQLDREAKVWIFEAASRMMEDGLYERFEEALVNCQRLWLLKERMGDLQKCVAAFDAAVEGFAARMIELAPIIQDLLDALEAPPPIAMCASHRTPMRGGRCTCCDRWGLGSTSPWR